MMVSPFKNTHLVGILFLWLFIQFYFQRCEYSQYTLVEHNQNNNNNDNKNNESNYLQKNYGVRDGAGSEILPREKEMEIFEESKLSAFLLEEMFIRDNLIISLFAVFKTYSNLYS